MAEQDNELLRWAAEDVLGLEWDDWADGWGTVVPIDDPAIPTDTGYLFYERDDLLGWPGFGIAVEAAKKRGMTFRLEQMEPYGIYGVSFWIRHSEKARGFDLEDPALAAWAALREALEGRE